MFRVKPITTGETIQYLGLHKQDEVEDPGFKKKMQRFIVRRNLQGCNTIHHKQGRKNMAAESVYRITELVGTSKKSWEDAASNAVNAASKTLRDLRVAEIIKLDMVVEDGKVAAYRARVALSFKYNPKK
jgi:flavin-binding protein dodecin